MRLRITKLSQGLGGIEQLIRISSSSSAKVSSVFNSTYAARIRVLSDIGMNRPGEDAFPAQSLPRGAGKRMAVHV